MSDQSKKAIIQLGGHQHLVTVGARVSVNRLKEAVSSKIELTDLLNNEPVILEVVEEKRSKKIVGLKFRPKSRYTRRYGHRQPLSELVVLSIGSPAPEPDKKKTKTETKQKSKNEGESSAPKSKAPKKTQPKTSKAKQV